jgi:hypothetical protein
VGDKVLDLLARGFAEGLGAAEIDGVRLDEVGVELVLAEELAEEVADLGSAVVSVFPIDRLFFDRREEGTGPSNDPISSTEQMPIP